MLILSRKAILYIYFIDDCFFLDATFVPSSSKVECVFFSCAMLKLVSDSIFHKTSTQLLNAQYRSNHVSIRNQGVTINIHLQRHTIPLFLILKFKLCGMELYSFQQAIFNLVFDTTLPITQARLIYYYYYILNIIESVKLPSITVVSLHYDE